MNTYPISNIAKHIKLLALDVDGVLTDGALYYSAEGEHLKRFYVHDGLGIKRLKNADIKTAIITSRQSKAITLRANELGIEHVFQNQANKLDALQILCNTLNLSPKEIAYMGDDLPDLCVMKAVGLSIAPANAVSYVKQQATWITERAGGSGAVREVCDFILQAQEVTLGSI